MLQQINKKRAAKAALKVKQGEKSDQFAIRINCLRPETLDVPFMTCDA
jgi:hypothetical protein